MLRQISCRPQKLRDIIDKNVLVLFVLIIVIIFTMHIIGPPDSLDMKLYYSGEQARVLFKTFSDSDLKAYFMNEIFDLCLLISYTFVFLILLQRIYSRQIWTVVLPLIIGISDFIETTVILSVLKFSVSQSVFNWLGIFSFLKWSIGLLVILLLLVGSVFKFKNY